MSIEENIEQAIDENLLAETGKKLKTLLNEGTQAKIDLAVLCEECSEQDRELERLKELESKAALVAKQKETFDDLKRELEKDRAILEAVRKERQDAKNQIFELARIAFDNPKLKFEGYVSSTSPDGSHMNAQIEGGEKTERS